MSRKATAGEWILRLISRTLFTSSVLVASVPGELRAQMEADVDERSGAATYRVPILTAPGSAGHSPELALTYRTSTPRGGAGWLGFGWMLSGLSAIERDLKFGAPYDYADLSCGPGPEGRDQPCYRDDFVLEGQDLICAERPCTSLYRTQVDDGRRIEFLGEQQGWELRDRAGRSLRYGSRPETQIENPKNKQVFAWLLDHIEDRNGNWIEYVYEQPPGKGVAYLSEIRYAQADAPANRSIRFILNDPISAPRPDRFIHYRAGFRQEVDHRLERIEVLANSELVTAYQLTYRQERFSERSLLAGIQRLGRHGALALPPHSFEYTSPFARTGARAADAGGFEETPTNFCSSSVACDNLNGFSGGDPVVTIATADFNRDGLADRYRIESTLHVEWEGGIPVLVTEGPFVSVYPGDGTRFRDPLRWDDSQTPFAERRNEGRQSKLTLDMDGDGFPDSVSSDGENVHGAPNWEVRLGSPSGFLDPALPWLTHWNVHFDQRVFFPEGDLSVVVAEAGSSHAISSLADVTGDGLPDRILTLRPYGSYRSSAFPELEDWGGWLVYPNLGLAPNATQGAFSIQPLKWGLPEAGRSGAVFIVDELGFFSRVTVDLNGDGLPDRVRQDAIAYGYGAGFDPWEAYAALPRSFPARSIAGCTRADLLDLNGNGFPDYVEVISGFSGGDRWKVHFGTGSGFQEEEALWAKPAFENQNCLVGIRNGVGNLGLIDLNGDGLLDRIQRSGLVYLNRGPVPGLLSRATHPLGGSVEFEYELSTQTKDPLGNPANPEMSLAQPVVTHMTVADGRPGTPQIVTEFHYSDGRFDYTEGEFRGFGTVTRLNLEASDPNTRGSEILSTYLTDRACAGRLSRREVRHGSKVYRREFHDYRVVGGPDVPGLATRDQWSRCLRIESRFEAIEGDEDAKRVRRVVHDYGLDPVAEHYNILRTEDWGEWDPTREADMPGDERITYFSYARPRDAGSQIVSEVAETWITDADDPASLLSHERFYYDGLPLGLVSRGLRTRVERLYENPHTSPPISGEWIATATIEYDRFGNARSVTGPGTEDDANGFHEWIAWDPVYQTFPVAIVAGADSANPVAHGFQYDGCVDGRNPPPALGLPCRTFRGSTALGGAELGLHEFAYDGLARVERIEFPGGLTETRSYALAEPGHVAESIWRSDLQLRDGTELRFVRVLDGLARVILEESPSRLSERIRIERGFDARGRLAWETLPHFADAPPGSVLSRAISYDPLARIRELLDFDATTRRVWSYAPWKLSEEVYFGEPSSANRQLRSERAFDGRGRLVRVTGFEPPGEASATPFDVAAEYDPLDRVVRIMDPIANDPSLCDMHAMGPRCRTQRHVTEIAYDSLGRRVRIVHPDAGTWTFRYDAAGLLKARKDGAGHVLSFVYDELQRPIAQNVSPAGRGSGPATFGYGTDPAEPSYGQLLRVNSPLTSYRYRYDVAGQRAPETQETRGWRFNHDNVYDELGRIARRTFPDGEVFHYTYDGLRLTRIEGDPANAYAAAVLQDARYDPLGRLLSLRIGEAADSDPVVALDYVFEPATARLTRITGTRARDPSSARSHAFKCYRAVRQGGTPGFAGRVVVLDDPSFGETKRGTLLKPIALCNPAEIDEGSAPTGAPSLACYRLRDAGPGFRPRRLEVVNRFGRETLTVYRPESLCAPGTPEGALPVPGFDHFKCYRAKGGNPSRGEVLVHDGVFAGPVTTHVRGRASAICNAVGKDGERIEEPTAHLACYDIHGAREQSGFQGRRYLGFQGLFGEENLHVLKPQRLCVPSVLSEPGARDLSESDRVMDLELEFDGLGRLVQQTGLLPDAVIRRAFSYDGLGRLKTALGTWEKARGVPNPVEWTFHYDPLANLRSQSSTGTYSRVWSYDHPTKPSFLTRFTDPLETQDMAADPGGNLSLRDGEHFSWNAQNRLHRISGRSSSSVYDAFARRVLRSSDGAEIIYVGSDFEYNTTLGRAHKFFFAGGQRIASLTTSDAPEPLPLRHRSRVAPFMAYVPDHLGSIRAVINQDGEIVETRDYGPFGRMISHSGGLEPEYGFTGQVRDPGTGLYDYGARMYDPRWGRFISPDERVQPIDPQGRSPYSYVLNRPTSLIDPTGEMAWIPALLVVGTTSAIAASAIGLLAPDQPGFQALQSALIGIAGLAATFGLAPAVAVTPTIGAIVELGSAATAGLGIAGVLIHLHAATFPELRQLSLTVEGSALRSGPNFNRSLVPGLPDSIAIEMFQSHPAFQRGAVARIDVSGTSVVYHYGDGRTKAVPLSEVLSGNDAVCPLPTADSTDRGMPPELPEYTPQAATFIRSDAARFGYGNVAHQIMLAGWLAGLF